MSLDTRMQAIWYGRRGVSWLLLLPLSGVFYCIVALRYRLFARGSLRSVRVTRPVIVVGNLTVGGTGKTPLVIWLANRLSQQGFKVAVITRGYGGHATHWPQTVRADSPPHEVGDEAVLLAQQTDALVIAGPDRVADAEQAIAAGAEVIVTDDGLQHYRLQRDCELVVIDGSRLLGNGTLLPAGPLREPAKRLRRASLILLNQRDAHARTLGTFPVSCIHYRVQPLYLRSLSGDESLPLDTWRGQQVHVVTGIGNPQAFIAALREQGLDVAARVLPDHAVFSESDLKFDDSLPVLMTEKDAVKCRAFATVRDGRRYWSVHAEVVFGDAAAELLMTTVNQAIASRAAT